MHELSIAVALVEAAASKVEELGPVRLDAVHVRIGPLAGVVEAALRFSFDVAAEGTAVAGARLVIESEPAVVWCAHCREEREIASVQHRTCPVCDRLAPRLLSGDSLELTALEVVDDAAPDR